MGSFYMEATQINYRRDDTFKTVDQKLQELSETSAIDTDIAPVFKSTNTYAPGDMVYYRSKLYTFNVEHSGAWAAGDVTATDVTTEISSLRSGLNDVNSDIANLVTLVAQGGIHIQGSPLSASVITAANAAPVGITFYAASNTPANQPTGHEWGAYIFLKRDAYNVTIIYIDKTAIACTYALDPTTAESITWHIA